MILGGVAGGVLLFKFGQFGPETPPGLVLAEMACLLTIALSVLFGIAGVVTSFAIKADGVGHFQPADNWLAELLDHEMRKAHISFCDLTVKVVALMTLAVIFIGVVVVIIFSVLYLTYWAVTLHPMLSVGGITALVIFALLVHLYTRTDAIGKVSRSIMRTALVVTAVVSAVYYSDQVPWDAVRSSVSVGGWKSLINIGPIVLVVLGVIGAILFFRYFSKTKVYQKMCPKHA